ncbi:kinase-like domain-containing protein [Rhizophagus diaphanus]|nr:kinase-like domain-containing protein [Rhizophagus diaphanus] [Rhizophagus sp. MUCL 43196]
MVVLDFNKCGKCDVTCNSIHFQRNFKNWTSGNNNIDKFIQDTQLSVHNDSEPSHTLEWIPYDRLYDIEYITDDNKFEAYRINWINECIHGWVKEALKWIPYDSIYDIKYITDDNKFGKVYKAKWIDGYIDKWGYYNKNWKRKDQDMVVALKSLDNSKNVTLEFMNEIALHYKVNLSKCIIKFYGITQDPETQDYIMVLDYAENGSLRNYLDTSHNELSWIDKINYLHSIAHGLKDIHENELIHRDLHIGNILRLKDLTCITDMGLCKPADYNASINTKNTKHSVHGVLPYIAPEILRGQKYTKAADIYSFGIIMYEVISGLPPYYDEGHDINLAIKICKGVRPRFNIKVPQLIVCLIKRCLDANQLDRPKIEEIKEILSRWYRESCSKYHHYNATINKQIKEAENINNSLQTSSLISTNLGVSYETHSEAIYTSRLLGFRNLPEPKNSEDYYEQNDNIISVKFSGIYW